MTGARRVVVTGAGVVSPVGIGRSAFHDSLVAGRSGIDSISLFDASRFVTSIAAEVKGYDPGAFVDLPGEVAPALADRKVGFVLGAARMALDEAFGRSWSIPYPAGARGLSLGVGVEIFKMDDIVPWCREQGDLDPEALARHLAGRSFMDSFRIPSDLGPAILGRLAGVHGPRRVNVGACVASAQAIGEGFRMVQRGRAQLVLAGGADSMINPLAVAGFGLLAATTGSSHLKGRASRPFDLNRDGFVLGEGAAVVVLEERTAARARGARILAEIAGYGTSMDAFKITDPAEDGAGAIQSMRLALADAGIPPEEIGYINAHGTSTVKNDAVETGAIKRVFGQAAHTVPISSTKSMIGHAIAAAGAMEFVASLVAFDRGLIPPTMNLETPDPLCDLDYVPGQARPATVETFLSNSFGFGGQNATLIVSEGTDR